MATDLSRWTGEGTFTPVLVQAIEGIEAVEHVKVEDAPASRADAGYAFIANEIYVTFRTGLRDRPIRRFGIFPGTRRVAEPVMTIGGLAAALAAAPGVGAPDYADEGMLQYLRAERVVAPYQTKGIKVVEMVRIYEAGCRSTP